MGINEVFALHQFIPFAHLLQLTFPSPAAGPSGAPGVPPTPALQPPVVGEPPTLLNMQLSGKFYLEFG